METRDRATVEFERLQAAVARSDDGLEQGLKLNSGEIMERAGLQYAREEVAVSVQNSLVVGVRHPQTSLAP